MPHLTAHWHKEEKLAVERVSLDACEKMMVELIYILAKQDFI